MGLRGTSSLQKRKKKAKRERYRLCPRVGGGVCTSGGTGSGSKRDSSVWKESFLKKTTNTLEAEETDMRSLWVGGALRRVFFLEVHCISVDERGTSFSWETGRGCWGTCC